MPAAEAPDLIAREFSAAAPDCRWCANPAPPRRAGKQVWTREGWLCVVAVIDRASVHPPNSRRIVGLAFALSPTTALVERALASAAARRRPRPGLVHHADRGAAYVSGPFLTSLQSIGAVQSLSRPGTPLGNAVWAGIGPVESFFSTLARELLAGRRFATRAEAQSAIFEDVEVLYNRQRRHSTLGYLSPADFEVDSSTPRGVSFPAG